MKSKLKQKDEFEVFKSLHAHLQVNKDGNNWSSETTLRRRGMSPAAEL